MCYKIPEYNETVLVKYLSRKKVAWFTTQMSLKNLSLVEEANPPKS